MRTALFLCSSLTRAIRSLKLAKSAAKGRTMADPVGAIGPSAAASYAIAVTRKEQDQTDLQGQQAVQLIQSASAPKLETSGAVGTKLHFVA